MKTSLLTAMTFALVASFSATDADAAPKSKYAKFKNDVGNCIFSASPLPKGKEATYKVATSFIAEQTPKVYARCYYVETLAKLGKHGKLFNSIRDQKKRFGWFKMGGYGGTMLRQAAYKITSKSMGWSEQYFYFCKASKCDSRADLRERMLLKYKGLMKSYKKKSTKLPFKQQFCVQVTYQRADRYKSLVTKALDVKNAPIAEGCFEYVLTKGE